MALVNQPLMSADARGTVGGITYSKTFAGNVAKIKPVPPRRRRGFQPRNRSLIGFLSRRWGGLSDADRAEWKTWALNHPEPDRFGGTFIMSGINAFTKLNFQAMRLKGSAFYAETPPSDPPAASVSNFAASAGAVDPGDIDLVLSLNGTGDADDVIEIQRAGPFQSEGLVEVHSQFKMVDTIAGNETTHTDSDLVEGFWYWYRVRYVDQYGQTTAFSTDNATPKLTV